MEKTGRARQVFTYQFFNATADEENKNRDLPPTYLTLPRWRNFRPPNPGFDATARKKLDKGPPGPST